ncbi:hypothetical protein [Promicromonospora sp. NPDC019610]|uniref:hypothetical protein n=1 Tax=Promicromonospora sp. NPDC019610 TaxID=3364405 RepID=UPI00379EDFC1
MRTIALAVALAASVAGCTAGNTSPSVSSSAEVLVHDLGQASCEGTGAVWTGSESGCLDPREVEGWKTSGCGDQDYATCRELGFHDFWELNDENGNPKANEDESTDSWLADKISRDATRTELDDGSTPLGSAADTPSSEGIGEAVVSTWSCWYSATDNYDWHDDVVCSNGTESERPYLRGWDDFVTEAEIMESARDHQIQLNGG